MELKHIAIAFVACMVLCVAGIITGNHTLIGLPGAFGIILFVLGVLGCILTFFMGLDFNFDIQLILWGIVLFVFGMMIIVISDHIMARRLHSNAGAVPLLNFD